MGAIRSALARSAFMVSSISILAVVGASAIARDSESPGIPANTDSHVRQVEVFQTLTQMTEASDAVIRGSIEFIRPGRTFAQEGGGVAFTEVVVSVDEVLFGSLREETVILEIDDAMFPGLRRLDRPWPVDGGSTILFLHRKVDVPTKFRPINSQGAYAVEGTDLYAADEVDQLAALIASQPVTDLVNLVRSVKP